VNLSNASSRTHFVMAIAAALIISIGLTCTAAVAGLISKPTVKVEAGKHTQLALTRFARDTFLGARR
jgi:hypothetical protein